MSEKQFTRYIGVSELNYLWKFVHSALLELVLNKSVAQRFLKFKQYAILNKILINRKSYILSALNSKKIGL